MRISDWSSDVCSSDLAARHEQAAVADRSDHAAPLGAEVHGDVLTDHVVGADAQFRGLALVLQVLRGLADRGERIDPGERADGGAAVDDDVAEEAHPLVHSHLAADDTVGTEFALVGALGARVRAGGPRSEDRKYGVADM